MARNSIVRALVSAAAIILVGSTVWGNGFANPSFEDPVTNDGPPYVGFWEGFSLDGDQDTGADVARNSASMARTGAQSLEVAIVNLPNSFAGVFQDVPNLTAGDTLSFMGWHLSLADPGGIEIRIEWRDSVNDVEISRTPNFTPVVGSTYEMFRVDGVVPAGADLARCVYAIQSFGGVLNQQVFVDDVAFVMPVGAAKAMSSSAGNGLPSTVTIDYVLENFSEVTVDDLSAVEDLTAAFGTHGVDWTFTSISSTDLVVNAGFNGHADTELIEQTAGTEQDLAALSTATITVEVQLLTHAGDSDMDLDLCNQFTVTGVQAGTTFSDLSTNGSDPDPGADGLPGERDETCFTIPVELMTFTVE